MIGIAEGANLLLFKNNNQFFINFKLLAALLLAAFLSSCGSHDTLYMRHHQLGMFWNYRYQELDTSLDEQYNLYKAGKLKGAELSLQIQAIEYANDGADAKFADYVEAMPNSKWSHLLYGLYLAKQAGDARGSETYGKTPQASFEKMRELAKKAKELLEVAHEHQAPFGLYAGGMMYINLLLNEDDENKSLVDEAIARDGDIWSAPFTYFKTLYPQWGGSEKAMAEFVVEVRSKNPKLSKALQADFHWRRGRAYKGDGQIDAAIAEYEKAISFYHSSYALTDLGGIYMQAGKCDAAVELFKRDLAENDEWDLYSLESLMQAHDCAGNSWQFSRVKAKRSELFARYRAGE